MHAERACWRAVGPLVIGRCFAMCGTVRRLVRRSMPDGRERSPSVQPIRTSIYRITDESAASNASMTHSLAPEKRYNRYKSAQSNALERSERRSLQPYFRHVDMTAATNSRRTVDAARFRRHFNRPCSADARQLRTLTASARGIGPRPLDLATRGRECAYTSAFRERREFRRRSCHAQIR